MNTHILQTDVLDILFAGKNKDYGAYQLRTKYNRRLTTALLITVLVCLFASLTFRLYSNNRNNKIAADLIGPEVTLAKVEPVEPSAVQPPLVKPLPVKPVHVATIKVSTPRIVEDNQVTAPSPTQDNLDGLKIDVVTINGNKCDIIAPPVNEGTGIKDVPRITQNYEIEFKTVQIQAKFPGGNEAWVKYLQRNLRQDTPTENGAPAGNYTVIVSFLVDKTGAISEVKAENDPGYGTAAEAVRVIQRGPAWQPAVQNGRNIIYRQKQSITFIVTEP